MLLEFVCLLQLLRVTFSGFLLPLVGYTQLPTKQCSGQRLCPMHTQFFTYLKTSNCYSLQIFVIFNSLLFEQLVFTSSSSVECRHKKQVKNLFSKTYSALLQSSVHNHNLIFFLSPTHIHFVRQFLGFALLIKITF